MKYSRFVAKEAKDGLDLTKEHVRVHLAAVADEDDDPNTHADGVRIWVEEVENGWMVYGELDAEPQAYYLRPDYNPETDNR